MLRAIIVASATILAFSVSAEPSAQQRLGTEAEARALLEKAVKSIQADKGKTLELLRKKDPAFSYLDLYVFCANAGDGIFTVHPRFEGTSIRSVKDKNGKALGEEMMQVAAEGRFDTVEYVSPRPGETTPVPRAAFVTKVADQVCGVGYYK